MKSLLSDAAERSADYLDGLKGRRVAPAAVDEAGLDSFVESLPNDATTAEEILRLLDENAGPATVASAGPRYFGYVTGGGAHRKRRAFLAARPLRFT